MEDVPLAFLSHLFQTLYWFHFGKSTFNAVMNYFIHLSILLLDGCCERLRYYVDDLIQIQFFLLLSLGILQLNKKLKFSAKIYLDDVMMTYVGLSTTSERSTTPISARI